MSLYRRYEGDMYSVMPNMNDEMKPYGQAPIFGAAGRL